MNKLKTESGFTLLEVMVALLLLVVGLLAHMAFTVSIIRTNNNSGNYTEASALAQDKLEELTHLPFSHADLADTNPGNNSSKGLLSFTPTDIDHQETNIDEKGNAGGRYTRTWNVWNVSTKKKEIVVIVNWRSANGSMKRAIYSTVKTD